MGTEYKLESLTKVLPKLLPLIRAHANEVSDYEEPDLDIEVYTAMEEAGALKLLVAYDKSSQEPIGYISMIVTWFLHKKTILMAECDAIYVLPKYRSRGVGIRLILGMEKLLKDIGVHRIYFQAKVSNDLEKVLHKLGYRTFAVNTVKELER